MLTIAQKMQYLTFYLESLQIFPRETFVQQILVFNISSAANHLPVPPDLTVTIYKVQNTKLRTTGLHNLTVQIV